MDVDPTHQIILIGPNGVGKTRFAVDLVGRNNPRAERISANRFIGLAALPRQADNELKSNSQNALQRQLSEYWEVHNEYTFLMSQMLEEDKSAAQKYRKKHRNGETLPDELIETRLEKITSLWHRLFPGRTLNLDYEPTVLKDGDSTPYATARMSEGERTALYLITRLASSSREIILVDEPEIHFHPLLARQFWNEMEAFKQNALFVYVTHDIPFALSRKSPTIYVVRSPGTFDAINGSEIPNEAINAILGAASFSISASRLVFCEGAIGDTEQTLLSAWYNCPNTAVIPVGGCERVQQCVAVFNANHATRNITAIGHLDRDDWPDDMLTRSPMIKPLPVNEIEGLICFEPVFKALAVYYGHSDADARFQSFLELARNSVKGFILNKHALNRAKLVLELKQQDMRNSVKPDSDEGKMRAAYLAGVPTTADAETILNNEVTSLTAALASTDLLLKFPAKTYQGPFPAIMQVASKKAFTDICEVLTASDEELQKNEAKKVLKDSIVEALKGSFFDRRV
ncbi:AAA family ATPase [uncultured Bradyrhizobium sp.]|uniref:ATP-dependent nuclease n=1 Tax=uncultured Bradyrhizobium sp. TaxID=199684 RepID=UPI00261493A9|nr:AAA family ATPase [uncultured Bradyrhizobium sp.]